MPPKRKAVDDGNIRKRSTKSRRTTSATNATGAESDVNSDASHATPKSEPKSNLAMNRSRRPRRSAAEAPVPAENAPDTSSVSASVSAAGVVDHSEKSHASPKPGSIPAEQKSRRPRRNATRTSAGNGNASSTADVVDKSGPSRASPKPGSAPAETKTRRPRRGAAKAPVGNDSGARSTNDAVDQSEASRASPKPDSAPAETKTGRPRRNATKAPARGVWDEERLATSTNSRLIELDLVGLFAKPEAWTCLDEDEKQEILSLLPEHVHPIAERTGENETEAKIPPLPESFLRYSTHWRDAVRQFQTDLENGRYDPEWQRRAKEASRQRAEGRFDNFKEKEFEQFWGQKQRVAQGVSAGESSQVKLETLVHEGIIRVGDIWKFSHTFGKGRGKPRIFIEKEAKVVEIEGKHLSFVMPPGQRAILPQASDEQNVAILKPELSGKQGRKRGRRTGTEVNGASEAKKDSPNQTIENPEAGNPPESEPGSSKKVKHEHGQDQSNNDGQVQSLNEKDTPPEPTNPIPHEGEPSGENGKADQNAEVTPNSAEKPKEEQPDKPPEAQPGPEEPSSTPSSDITLISVPNITGPTPLVLEILKADGRIENLPSNYGNAWKETRCYRDNQDMGSLWELREALFLRGK